MPEHSIRLRGGWEWHEGSGPSATRQRLTLPGLLPTAESDHIRLVRAFGCPALDHARERLVLRLGDVPGLLIAWLNDRELARPAEGCATLEIGLDLPLPARNVLLLDVNPSAQNAGGRRSAWGNIAIVVVSPESVTPGTVPTENL